MGGGARVAVVRCPACERTEADGATFQWRQRPGGRAYRNTPKCHSCRAADDRARYARERDAAQVDTAPVPGLVSVAIAGTQAARFLRLAEEYEGFAAGEPDDIYRRRCLRAARDYRALAVRSARRSARQT